MNLDAFMSGLDDVRVKLLNMEGVRWYHRVFTYAVFIFSITLVVLFKITWFLIRVGFFVVLPVILMFIVLRWAWEQLTGSD